MKGHDDMSDARDNAALLSRLETFGDPRNTREWETGEEDYVAQLAVTPGDVPELLAIARKWTEPQTDWPDDKDYVAGYAPVHAWRCLGQLGAVEAVGPLLEMMDPLDAQDDDWYLEEFPHVFAWIGQEALGPLTAYLADTAHRVYPRAAAARALSMLAERHPQIRDDVVPVLCDTLERFEENDESLNAFIIMHLVDLEATGAAELVERAFAADRVDLFVNGNWNDARERLGVTGIGLVPAHLAGATRSPFDFLRSPKDAELPADEPDLPPDDADLFDDDADLSEHDEQTEDAPPPDVHIPYRAPKKVGRNEPCPCGSGKKYKKCCGR